MVAKNDDKSSAQFGKLSRSAIDPNPAGVRAEDAEPGILPLLNRSDALVYLSVCGHLDGSDWRARIGQRRIAALTGLHQATVSTAIQRLVAMGAVVIREPAIGRRPPTIEVVADPLRSRPGAVTTCDRAQARSQDGVAIAPDGVCDRASNALRSRPGAISSEDQIIQQQSARCNQAQETGDTASATNVAADSIKKEIEALGISGKPVDELATAMHRAGVVSRKGAALLVAEVADLAGNNGGAGPGQWVLSLRQHLPDAARRQAGNLGKFRDRHERGEAAYQRWRERIGDVAIARAWSLQEGRELGPFNAGDAEHRAVAGRNLDSIARLIGPDVKRGQRPPTEREQIVYDALVGEGVGHEP